VHLKWHNNKKVLQKFIKYVNFKTLKNCWCSFRQKPEADKQFINKSDKLKYCKRLFFIVVIAGVAQLVEQSGK